MRLRTHSELEAENERLKQVIADAYQCVGAMLDALARLETDAGQELMEYLHSEGREGRAPLANEFWEDWTR